MKDLDQQRLQTVFAAECPKPRTGLVTLLFTDTVGSTALKQQLGDQGGAALFRKHHQLVRELLARFPTGQEIETAGDSFLITFSTPSDAVRFGLLLQSGLRQLKEKANVTLQDRIGIHVGEVVLEGDQTGSKPRELYGIQIDTCSRVMSLANGGQVLLSRSAFDSARQVLKGEDIPGVGPLEWLNHGPYLLKGLDESIEICEVKEAGQPASGPPAGSEKAQRQVSPEAEPILGWRPAIGQMVPNTRWLLEKKLGEGGFGEVWLGRHQTMKERRVFKFCFRADRVRSLKREMTLFRLIKERIGDHPNIVSLRDVCFDQPPFYVEMDYLEGHDLRAWSDEQGGLGSIPLEMKLEIVAQVADALQAAHDAGVIHRDVKPANILIADSRGAEASDGRGRNATWSAAAAKRSDDTALASGGDGSTDAATTPSAAKAGSPLADSLCPRTPNETVSVKLTDFGIGQVVSQEHLAGMTRAGFTMTLLGSESSSQTGTQVYMAPEILAGKPATPRSDVYSLGVVFYQMLVGDFSQPLTVDWAGQVQDPLLRQDLTRCFTSDQGERFGSAAELARNLRRFPERQAERQRRETEKATLERAAYRRGIVRTAGVAAVIVVMMTGLALLAAGQSRRAARTAESLEQHLYCSEMAVAWQAWEQGHADRTRRLLTNRLQALRPGHDLRGFEWRYLWGRSRPQELFVLEGAGKSVKFSPDGRLVATVRDDKEVMLWDVPSRTLVKSFSPYQRNCWALAFSPDGKRLATASRGDDDFKVWDVATANLLATLPATNQQNVSVVFSPDGKRLATVATTPYQPIPAEIKIWDLTLQPPRAIMSFPGTGDSREVAVRSWVFCSDFSPDGETLAFADGEGLVRLWNLRTGAVRILTGHTGYVPGVKFSSDGRILATGDQNGTILLWDWRTGTILHVLTGHLGPVLAIAAGNQVIASGSLDHTAKLWDLNTGEELARFLGHLDRVWSLAISPDGRTLATTSGDATRFWSTKPNREGEILTHTKDEACGVGYSPDSRVAFLDEYDEEKLSLFDVAAKSRIRTLSGRDLHYSPDGKMATLLQGDATVVTCDAANLQVIDTFQGQGRFHGGTAISPDHQLLAVRRKDIPTIIDLKSKREIATLDALGGGELFFSPDGKRILVQENDRIRIWDTATWRPIASIGNTANKIDHVAFCASGGMLATASGETVRIWTLKGLVATDSVLGQTASDITRLAFSSDGKNVAAGTFDGAIILWNVPGRQEVGAFRLHRSIIRALAFAPDNHSLISQSYDSTVRLWTAPP